MKGKDMCCMYVHPYERPLSLTHMYTLYLSLTLTRSHPLVLHAAPCSSLSLSLSLCAAFSIYLFAESPAPPSKKEHLTQTYSSLAKLQTGPKKSRREQRQETLHTAPFGVPKPQTLDPIPQTLNP